MNFRGFCKAIMAGMFFPAIFLTFIYTFFYFCNISNIKSMPFQLIPMYIPLLFGITNCLYIGIGDNCPIKNSNLRLWVTGGILGLVVSLTDVFVFNIPSLLFNLSGSFIVYTQIYLLLDNDSTAPVYQT